MRTLLIILFAVFTHPVGHIKQPGSTAPSPPLGGLAQWVAADLGVTKNGSNQVSAWADQSGNNRNYSLGAGVITYVPSALNGLPVLRGGTSTGSVANYLTCTAFFTGTQAAEVMLVLKSNTSSDNYSWGGFSSESGSVSHYGYYLTIYESFASPVRRGGFVTIPGTQILSYNIMNVYGSASTTWTIAVAGTNIGTSTGVTPSWHTGNFTLFSFWFNQNYNFNGDIAEVIIYDHVLSSGDRALAYSYLQTKWGVP